MHIKEKSPPNCEKCTIKPKTSDHEEKWNLLSHENMKLWENTILTI